jgi:L-threonylcarbamoyladenylate synthase
MHRAGGGLAGMCGVAAPSANRFGRISPTEAAHVRDELGDAVKLILDGGRCPVGIESTILDLTRGSRRAAASAAPRPDHPEQIATGHRRTAGDRRTGNRAIDTPRVSGSLAAHYAPTTPLRLVAKGRLAEVIAGCRLATAVPSSATASCPAHRREPCAACRTIHVATRADSTRRCANSTRPAPI